MSLREQVTHTLQTLVAKLNKTANTEKLVGILQSHQSFISQSEKFNDYIKETEKLIQLVFMKEHQLDERLADRLNDQLDLLAKLALKDKLVEQDDKTHYTSRVGKMHQKLALYRQYLAKFDDQIRMYPNMSKDHQIFVRRERCITAINQLEEQISKIEQKGYGTNRYPSSYRSR